MRGQLANISKSNVYSLANQHVSELILVRAFADFGSLATHHLMHSG